MPQPAANDRAAESLIRQYEQAQQALNDRLALVLDAPNRRAETARLRELLGVLDGTITELRTASAAWITGTLPELHASGATMAADLVGTSFRWTQEHRAAVEQLAGRTWGDVAARLQEMDTATRRILRREIADATRATLLESRTAVQAGRDVARAAREAGLWTVRYSNGAEHSIADWADSAVRQVTAETYNRGAVEQCRTDGIEHVEYVDGPGCSVGPGHRNGPEANGLVVALDDVVWTAHPRCRRSCLPSFDGATYPPETRDPGPERPPEPPTEPVRTPRDRLAEQRQSGRQERTARA